MKQTTKTLLIAFFAVLCMAMLLLSASAVEGGTCGDADEEGNSVAWQLDDNGVLTISGSGRMADYYGEGHEEYDEEDDCWNWVVIYDTPWFDLRDRVRSVVIGGGVTRIGQFAFADCANMTEVSIAYGVEEIGYAAFYNCASLTSAALPDSVYYLDGEIFWNCTGLTSVTLPGGISNISYWMFENCTSLTNITLPEGVSSIEAYAFYNCASLTSVALPDGLESIGQGAFCCCASLTSVTLPEDVRSIGGDAFNDCVSLTSVTLPDGLESIGGHAFNGTPFYDALPDGPVYFGNILYGYKGEMPEGTIFEVAPGTVSVSGYAFYECAGLAGISLPDSVAEIGDSAFYGCSSLTEVVLPEALTSIGWAAFAECASLRSVVIPENVWWIDEYAFDGCAALSEITVPMGADINGEYVFPETTTLVCHVGTCAHQWAEEHGRAYRLFISAPAHVSAVASADNGVTVFWDAVPGATQYNIYQYDGVKKTYSYKATVRGATRYALTGLTEGDVCSFKVVAVYKTAEQTIVSEKSAAASAKVVAVTASGFCGEEGENVIWTLTADGVLTISGSGRMADYFGEGHEEYDEADDCWNWVVIYDTPWFDLRDSVRSVVIGDGVTRIGQCAFADCANMTEVSIAYGVEEIGYAAFYNCASLTSAALPDSVETIENEAFRHCASLTDVKLPQDLQRIPSCGFEYCVSLTEIVLPARLTYVGSHAFGECANLAEIVFPEGDYWISEYALANTAWYDAQPDGPVYIDRNLYDYKGEMPENTRLVIRPGTVYVNRSCFGGQDHLIGVVFPDSVGDLGETWMFAQCHSLSEVVLPRNLNSIPYATFNECTSLKTLFIPESVRYIEDEDAIPEETVICGYPGSYAQQWAQEHGRIFAVQPTVPQNVKAVPSGANGIVVSWNAVEGATQYNVYRQAPGKKVFSYLGTVHAGTGDTTYTDTGLTVGSSYAYKVVAVNKTADYTIVSDKSAAASAVAGTPETVKGVAAVPCGANRIKVKWDAVPGATQYNIYRYNGAKKAYVYKGTTYASAANPTRFINKGLTAGVTYYYKVVAVNKTADYTLVSEKSAKAFAQAVGPTPAPVDVSAVFSCENQVTVTWSAVEAATQYNVYRFDGDKQAFVYKGTTFATAAKPTQYVDRGLASGAAYSYCVVAVNKTADYTISSEKSEAVSALPAVPQNVMAAASGANQITVTWDAVPGATQYNVYRYNGAKNAYVYKGTTFVSAAAPTQYVDKGLHAGTTYYYKVKAVNKTADYTIVSEFSAPASVGAAVVIASGDCSSQWEEDSDVTWTLYDNGQLVISGHGNMEDDDGILPGWEAYRDDITSLVVNEGVTNIGFAALKDCVNLKEIHLPRSLRTISYFAFEGCSGLTDVTIPDGVTRICFGAFSNCQNVESITIPASVTDIAEVDWTLPELATLTVEEGSVAQEWAQEHGRTFVVIPAQA